MRYRYFLITLFLCFSGFYVSAQDSLKTGKLEEVKVTAMRTEASKDDLTVPVEVLSKEQIRLNGAARLDELLAEQPGLLLTHNHGAGLQMQGFDPEYSLILIDGLPLIGRTAGTLDLRQMALGNVEQIEVMKGPASGLYGSEAMAGIVNIRTARPSTGWSLRTAVRGEELGLYNANVSASFGSEKAAFSVFADGLSAQGYDFTPGTYGQTVDPYRNFTVQSKIDYDLNSKINLNASFRHFGQVQEQYFAVKRNEEQETRISGENTETNTSGVLNAEIRHGNFFRQRFQLYAAAYGQEQVLHENESGEEYSNDYFDQTFLQPEWQGSFYFSDKHFLITGIGFRSENVESLRYADTQNMNNTYVFAQHEWRPSEKLNITGGGRLDSHSVYGTVLSPKISSRFNANEKLSVWASYGMAFKAPDFRQLLLDFTNSVVGYSVYGSEVAADRIRALEAEGRIAELLIDPESLGELEAERSRSLQVGADYRPNDRLNVSLSLFRHDISNMIQTVAVARKTNQQQAFSYRNLNEVFSQGSELQVRFRPVRRLSLSAMWQLLDVRDKAIVKALKNGEVFRRNPETQGSELVPSSDYTGLLNRSRHSLNFGAAWKAPKHKFSASVRYNYRSRYGVADFNGNGIADAENEFLAGYGLWNFTLMKGIGKHLELSAGCRNLFNFTNERFLAAEPGRRFWAGLTFQMVKKPTGVPDFK